MPNSNSSANALRNSCVAIALALLGVVASLWSTFQIRLSNFHAPLIANAPVVQGGHATFQTDLLQGPANGRCEIVAPNGAVVASFVSIAGGWDNGWGAQVKYNGWNERPTFTVTAPENAPVGAGYRISVASYVWPQSSARFAVVAKDASASSSPVPQTAPKPTATPLPMERADLAVRNAGAAKFIGQSIYDDYIASDEQFAEQMAVPDKTAVYEIRIQNRGKRAASFRVSAETSGKNWKWRYFAALKSGREITDDIADTVKNGITTRGFWETPVLPVGGEAFLRLEARAQSGASVGAAVVLRAANEQGVNVDAVNANISRQSIARIEATIDQGKTWKTVTIHGFSAPRWTVVGLRAVKANPKLDWPIDPFRPQWRIGQDGKNEMHLGAETWVHCDSDKIPFPRITATAICGNGHLTMIHITPGR